MDNISARWGTTVNLQFVNDEIDAQTLTFTARNEGEPIAIQKTVNFDGLIAQLVLLPQDTQIPLGEYEYMITIHYADGAVEKYPDTVDCENCSLPTIEICYSTDMDSGVVS